MSIQSVTPVVRAMTTRDLDKVVAIEEIAFSMPWTKEGFEGALNMPGSNYLVVEDGQGNVVGYCGYYSSFDEAEITNVAVLPNARKRGYASFMLKELLKQAKENLIGTVVLEVRASNAAAYSVYERLGFKNIGIRKDFYEKPKEDAIIMMLEI